MPRDELTSEPNLNTTRLYPVSGVRGMVVAGHPLAAAAAARVLMNGGNAVDASIAASSVLAVVRPHMCGIGGDLLMLVYEHQSRTVRALLGIGVAPLAIDRLVGSGKIPQKGPLAPTVPGLVDTWGLAMNRFGSRKLDSLLEDAIWLAANGFPVYSRLRHWITSGAEFYKRYPAAARVFLPNGRVPEEGQLFRQPQLVQSLELIGRNGCREFYEGELADRLVAAMARDGGLITADDLRRYHGAMSAPIAASYGGHRVLETPPTSQGYLVLESLNVISQVVDDAMPEEEVIHAMVETKKIVFGERRAVFGDPEFEDVPLQTLLDPAHGAQLARQLSAVATTDSSPESVAGDTSVFLVVDGNRNAVAGIQSNFYDSAYVAGSTGVLLNGRLQAFDLNPDSPNALEPGKKPVTTLNVWMATDAQGGLEYLGGSPGAHGQVQTNLQVLYSLLNRHLTPQQAVEAPRWIHGDIRQDGDGDYLALESRFSKKMLRSLAAKGHRLIMLPPWAEMTTGSAKVIAVDGEVLAAGVDPRRDAYAVAF